MTFRLLAAMFLVLLTSSIARAQFETGAVLGTVRDSSGGVLPGVSVTLLNVDTGISVVRTEGQRRRFARERQWQLPRTTGLLQPGR